MEYQNGKTSNKKANPLPTPPSSGASTTEAWLRGGINKRNTILLFTIVFGLTFLRRSGNSTTTDYSPTLAENGDGRHPTSGWIVPLMMSTAAGMSTCLGAATVFLASEQMGHAHLAFALSLAASVMMTVSVASILPEAFKDGRPDAEHQYLPFGTPEFVQRCVAFGVGSLLYVLISRFAFPDPEEILELEAAEVDKEKQKHYHENNEVSVVHRKLDSLVARRTTRSPCHSPINVYRTEALDIDLPLLHSKALSLPINDDSVGKNRQTSDQIALSCFAKFTRGSDLQTTEARRAWRVAMLLFVSLAVHNFPEGLAVAASAMHSEHLGLTTTIAIALHNIPEGIAIAIPCLAARPNDPWLAFGLASLSGLAEPLGALVALIALHRHGGVGDESEEKGSLQRFLSVSLEMDNVLAFVAGIMIFVAATELFPEARRHMKDSKIPGIAGAVVGVAVMLASDAYLDA